MIGIFEFNMFLQLSNQLMFFLASHNIFLYLLNQIMFFLALCNIVRKPKNISETLISISFKLASTYILLMFQIEILMMLIKTLGQRSYFLVLNKLLMFYMNIIRPPRTVAAVLITFFDILQGNYWVFNTKSQSTVTTHPSQSSSDVEAIYAANPQ